MKELIRKMISDLREQVVENVPEAGHFGIVHAEFKNPDKGMGVTDWMLKVTQPPKSLDEKEVERYLELVAYNLPSPYIAESVVGFGNKKDILKKLNDEDALIEVILNKMPKLARDLDDIR